MPSFVMKLLQTILDSSFLRIFPKDLNDRFAFSYLVLITVGIFFHNFYLLYIIFNRPENCFIYFVVLVYFLTCLNVLGSFLCLILTDTSILPLAGSSSNKENNKDKKLKYCNVCECDIPPRAFHCNVCKKCILKRHHHCAFSGCCVGYFNHRYHASFMIHLWFGALMSLFFNYHSDYIKDYISRRYQQLPFYVIVHVSWALGLVDVKEVLHFVAASSVVFSLTAGTLFLTGLLIYHGRLVVTNRTCHEDCRKIKKYSFRYWKENVKEVLGENWLGALLWFNYPSPLPSRRRNPLPIEH